MGLYSALFGGGRKKQDPEKMQKIARGQSVLGNLVGSSPYMEEWRRQNKENYKNYVLQEKSMRKKWAREDLEIARYQGKKRDEFNRRYAKNPKDAERFFLSWKMEQDRKLQRERDNELRDMKEEKNQEQRNISKNIKQWK